jgi:hypothetical protein
MNSVNPQVHSRSNRLAGLLTEESHGFSRGRSVNPPPHFCIPLDKQIRAPTPPLLHTSMRYVYTQEDRAREVISPGKKEDENSQALN